MHSLQIQLYATLGILKKNEGGKRWMLAESVGKWKMEKVKTKKKEEASEGHR